MGYWPSSFGQDGGILAKFFFCVFMDRDEVDVHKYERKKKERGQYTTINKGFIIRPGQFNYLFILFKTFYLFVFGLTQKVFSFVQITNEELFEPASVNVFLREHSGPSRAVKMAPSWPRG